MNFLPALFYSILSGLLLSAAWPVAGFYPIIFVACVPLLWLESKIGKPNNKVNAQFLSYALITTLTWNVCTTWWIKNASFDGAAMAIGANSIIMAMVLFLFHLVKNKRGPKLGYLSFIVFWLSFEYIHLRWDITWPWLNLGNCFANQIELVQWYEYTGVFGGSLWILVGNLLVFQLLQNWKLNKVLDKKKGLQLAALLIVPSIISLLIFYTYSETKNPINTLVVQPNIDPYNEKFSGMSSADQLQKLLDLTDGKLNVQTDYLIAPETALVDYIWENQFNESEEIKVLQNLIKAFPNLNIVIGASTEKLFLKGEAVSSTARKLGQTGEYYDSYNTALQLDKTGEIQTYHKSKLVPGVEKMPWPAVFKYIERFAIDLGGISGSLGMQDEREAFFSSNHQMAVAPIVCYESIYGEYVGEYVKKGATFLAIITNDGWWGDTPGYKQHLKYGALRAIESRRSIVRSANTGISAIINQKGEIVASTKWWTDDALVGQINGNTKLTFYTRFGDYIGVIAIAITLVVFVLLLLPKRH